MNMMSKSPLAKGSPKKVSHYRNNITPLKLSIPIENTSSRSSYDFSIEHLTHFKCDSKQNVITTRVPHIRKFAKSARKYAERYRSQQTISAVYDCLRSFIFFCDCQAIDPFSREGYLRYFGNDGEMRHQIKLYIPSLRLWQRSNGEELGLKESTCNSKMSNTIKALRWCGTFNESWKYQHRIFRDQNDPYPSYSEDEEKLIVSRLSNLFFGLASQLVAIKKDEIAVPEKLCVSINIGNQIELLKIPTSLKTYAGRVNKACAFNMAMGAAYYLMSYFTSLNSTPIKEIHHPLIVEKDLRDKSLQTVKVKCYKARANKTVSATLTNEVDSHSTFNLKKRTGVEFIKLLSELSLSYGSNKELLYLLDENGEISNKFDVRTVNTHLVTTLHLTSVYRSLNLPMLTELFYHTLEGVSIKYSITTNEIGRRVVKKHTHPLAKAHITRNLLRISYCILACLTDNSLKGIVLPLSYSCDNSKHSTHVTFSYDDGKSSTITIASNIVKLIKDIESWAMRRAAYTKDSAPVYLLRFGHSGQKPKQWSGINPITAAQISKWGIAPDDFFLTLQSSRFRESTSNSEYREGDLSHLTNLLQNSIATLRRHYSNGHPNTNRKILSEAIEVLENIAKGNSLTKAKDTVKEKLVVEMLTHDEWKKNRKPANPNGITCDGQQILRGGGSTQKFTNKAVKHNLPCAEFDMCFKCKSAKAVDEPNSIYKLISFIDVLKEALDHYPDAKPEIQEKISVFESTLKGASHEILQSAWSNFNQNGRHPRVTMDHARLSVLRYR